MQIKQETISPKRAAEMLGNARVSRNERPRRVEYFKDIIVRDDWEPDNPMPISLDTRGRLADGQHRLKGVIESGQSVKAWVATGVSESVIETIDTGRARKLSDVLKMKGETNVSILAAALRQIWNYQQYGVIGGSSPSREPTHHELVELLKKDPSIRESVSGIYVYFNEIRGVGPSLFAALYHIMAEKDEKDADAFFEGIEQGEGLESGSPILALRRFIIERAGNPNERRRPRTVAAITIKAWNAYRAGEPVKVLAYKAGGKNPEPFPVIE